MSAFVDITMHCFGSDAALHNSTPTMLYHTCTYVAYRRMYVGCTRVWCVCSMHIFQHVSHVFVLQLVRGNGSGIKNGSGSGS